MSAVSWRGCKLRRCVLLGNLSEHLACFQNIDSETTGKKVPFNCLYPVFFRQGVKNGRDVDRQHDQVEGITAGEKSQSSQGYVTTLVVSRSLYNLLKHFYFTFGILCYHKIPWMLPSKSICYHLCSSPLETHPCLPRGKGGGVGGDDESKK